MCLRESPRSFAVVPIGPATFVARITDERLLRIARPVISSDTPVEYTSAVSMKFPPASRKRATIRAEVGSSQPQALFPKVIVPRQRFETLRPVRPSLRSFIASSLVGEEAYHARYTRNAATSERSL